MPVKPSYHTDIGIFSADLTDALVKGLDAPSLAPIRKATSLNITALALTGEYPSLHSVTLIIKLL